MALDYQTTGFSDALVILGAAGLVIPAFARFRITPVIGFILVGVLVGPFGLGAAVPEHRWLEWVTISNPKGIAPFAELGIILLLFSIGLELFYARIWAMRKPLFGFGAAELIGSAAIIAVPLWIFGETPWEDRLGLASHWQNSLQPLWCCRLPGLPVPSAALRSPCSSLKILRWCQSFSCWAQLALRPIAGWPNWQALSAWVPPPSFRCFFSGAGSFHHSSHKRPAPRALSSSFRPACSLSSWRALPRLWSAYRQLSARSSLAC